MILKFFPLLILGFSMPVFAGPISLDQYLSQVRSGNDGFKASQTGTEGALLRSEEGLMLLAPTIFAGTQYSSDKRETINPTFQGTETKVNSYSLGISKLTTFGLQAKLSYEMSHAQIIGANPALLPLLDYHDARPVLELSQSLWRNFFGAETRAEQRRIEAEALASSYANSFRQKQIIAAAEGAYWRLSLARDVVRVQKDSAARAETMRDWMSKQSQMQLADKSDFLQSEAALKVKLLELEAAQDDERDAALAFNSIRGIDKGAVTETLASPNPDNLLSAAPPSRADLRDDVKQAKEQSRAAVAVADMSLQRASPTLEVYSTLSLNGRDATLSNATSESFKSLHPANIVGLRFSAPLNFGVLSETRSGYTKERVAAEQRYERGLFEQERDWESLIRKLGEAKERLKLTRSIETAQKEKLENERQRHRRGRSTTYQVILFEQDYSNAVLKRISTQGEILQILSQLKTFGG